MQSDAVDPAQKLLANERARWPRWRNSALKLAPTWFSGGELDIIGAEERRLLFDDVNPTVPRVQWIQLALPACWLPLLFEKVNLVEAHWLEAVGGVFFAAVLVGTTLLRRRNVLIEARRVLRERADWPKRLNEWSA